MKKRSGLPKNLEDETYKVLQPIFIKYYKMHKSHMPRDRIIAIMEYALYKASLTSRSRGANAPMGEGLNETEEGH